MNAWSEKQEFGKIDANFKYMDICIIFKIWTRAYMVSFHHQDKMMLALLAKLLS